MLRSSTKTYPLTTIDLCNLCAHPVGERYRALRDWQTPKAWISYAPTKKHWNKLVSGVPTLGLALESDEKANVLALIANDCRYGEPDVAANTAVSEAVWDWVKENDVNCVAHNFEPHRCSLATNNFFEPGILVSGEVGLAVLLDPRRSSSGLDATGKLFAFSAMYWKLAGNDDYVDVSVAIMKISDRKKNEKQKF